jgi:hypothetical protein
MSHDEAIEDLWRIKDEIAAECGYNVHTLAESLREDELKHPRDFVLPCANSDSPVPHT